jgi:hypothetical protein
VRKAGPEGGAAAIGVVDIFNPVLESHCESPLVTNDINPIPIPIFQISLLSLVDPKVGLYGIQLLIHIHRSWLEIPIFGSNFWDPHWKWNSNSVFDSEDSGWNFFLKFRC